MAEYVAVAAQDVAANGNVVYTNTAVKGTACVQHREGSGIVTLRGMTNQFCKYRRSDRRDSRSNLHCNRDRRRTGLIISDDIHSCGGGSV